MTVILALPLLAVKAVTELLFGTTAIEQRILEHKVRAQMLTYKGF